MKYQCNTCNTVKKPGMAAKCAVTWYGTSKCRDFGSVTGWMRFSPCITGLNARKRTTHGSGLNEQKERQFVLCESDMQSKLCHTFHGCVG